MNRDNFPWVAIVIGFATVAGLFASGALSGGESRIPLLMLLFMSEFGGLVAAAGAYMAATQWLAHRERMPMLLAALTAAILAAALLLSGVMIWQQQISA